MSQTCFGLPRWVIVSSISSRGAASLLARGCQNGALAGGSTARGCELAVTRSRGSGRMRTFRPACQPGSRAGSYPYGALPGRSIRWSRHVEGMFIHAPGLAHVVKILARNLDGTPLRQECVMAVKSQVSRLQSSEGGPSVKPSACAYVGSNPTPATHNPRSGPVCGPGLSGVRERSRGPFPVAVGQLWARSGQVSGLRAVRPRFRGGGDCASGPLPSDGCFRSSRPRNRCRPGPAWSR
jgi:hypothetical protein